MFVYLHVKSDFLVTRLSIDPLNSVALSFYPSLVSMSVIDDRNAYESLLMLCKAVEPDVVMKQPPPQTNSQKSYLSSPQGNASRSYPSTSKPISRPPAQPATNSGHNKSPIQAILDEELEVEKRYLMKRKRKADHFAAKRPPLYSNFYMPQSKDPNSPHEKDGVRNVELESIPAHLFGAFNAGDFHCLHDIIESITTPDMVLCTESLIEPLVGRRHFLSFFEALIDGHPDAFMICSSVRFLDSKTIMATINFKGTKALPSEKEYYFMKPRLVDNMDLSRFSHRDVMRLVDLEYSLITQNKPIEVDFVGTMTLIFDGDVHSNVEAIVRGPPVAPSPAFKRDNISTIGHDQTRGGSESTEYGGNGDSPLVATNGETTQVSSPSAAVEIKVEGQPPKCVATATVDGTPCNHQPNISSGTSSANTSVAASQENSVPQPEPNRSTPPPPPPVETIPLCKCRIAQVNFSHVLKSFQEAIIPPVPPEVDYDYSRRI